MTVEDLHDALTLLPAELVAEADKRRGRKPVKIQWRRLAGMAACLVVILGCSFWLWVSGMRMGSSQPKMEMSAASAWDSALPEDAPGAAAVPQGPMLQNAAPTEAGPDERKSAASGVAADQGAYAPGIGNIRWVETPCEEGTTRYDERKVFLADHKGALEDYLMDCDRETADTLRESTLCYDEIWFAYHDLVLIQITCGADTTVEDVHEAEGQWEISLSPSRVSLLRDYHMLVEVEKGAIESADRVTVTYGES